jgi:hypothetical protein
MLSVLFILSMYSGVNSATVARPSGAGLTRLTGRFGRRPHAPDARNWWGSTGSGPTAGARAAASELHGLQPAQFGGLPVFC